MNMALLIFVISGLACVFLAAAIVYRVAKAEARIVELEAEVRKER